MIQSHLQSTTKQSNLKQDSLYVSTFLYSKHCRQNIKSSIEVSVVMMMMMMLALAMMMMMMMMMAISVMMMMIVML